MVAIVLLLDFIHEGVENMQSGGHQIPESTPPNKHSVHSSVMLSSAKEGVTAVSYQILPPPSVFDF